jgi:hypothetical protein
LVGSGAVGTLYPNPDSDNSSGNDIYWLCLPAAYGSGILIPDANR